MCTVWSLSLKFRQLKESFAFMVSRSQNSYDLYHVIYMKITCFFFNLMCAIEETNFFISKCHSLLYIVLLYCLFSIVFLFHPIRLSPLSNNHGKQKDRIHVHFIVMTVCYVIATTTLLFHFHKHREESRDYFRSHW